MKGTTTTARKLGGDETGKQGRKDLFSGSEVKKRHSYVVIQKVTNTRSIVKVSIVHGQHGCISHSTTKREIFDLSLSSHGIQAFGRKGGTSASVISFV